MINAAKSAPAAGAGPAKAAAAPVADEKKEEKEEMDMGNLFGDEDDGYWEACCQWNNLF